MTNLQFILSHLHQGGYIFIIFCFMFVSRTTQSSGFLY